MKTQDYLEVMYAKQATIEAKIEGSDKANAARARNVAKLTKEGLDRNDERSMKRAATTMRGLKKVNDNATKNTNKIIDRVGQLETNMNDAANRVTSEVCEHVDRRTGSASITWGQWFLGLIVGLVTGLLSFLFLLAGAEKGVFLCTSTEGAPITDLAGNFVRTGAMIYEPWMIAIWAFTILLAAAGFLFTLGICSFHNANKH